MLPGLCPLPPRARQTVEFAAGFNACISFLRLCIVLEFLGGLPTPICVSHHETVVAPRGRARNFSSRRVARRGFLLQQRAGTRAKAAAVLAWALLRASSGRRLALRTGPRDDQSSVSPGWVGCPTWQT